MALTAEEAIKWKWKMCISSGGCSKCEIGKEKAGMLCAEYCIEYPEKVVSIIERYKNEHSKTLEQDFFEKFPNAPKTPFGLPTVCPYQVGYEKPKEAICVKEFCKREECWNRLLEEV